MAKKWRATAGLQFIFVIEQNVRRIFHTQVILRKNTKKYLIALEAPSCIIGQRLYLTSMVNPPAVVKSKKFFNRKIFYLQLLNKECYKNSNTIMLVSLVNISLDFEKSNSKLDQINTCHRQSDCLSPQSFWNFYLVFKGVSEILGVPSYLYKLLPVQEGILYKRLTIR